MRHFTGINLTVISWLVFLQVSTTYSQNAPKPTAKFSFNDGKDFDEVSGKKIKQVGINYTEDRFNNRNSAVFILGNASSYINLGNSPALKPKEGSISLWVRPENKIYSGIGHRVNPIIMTKCSNLDDFYEAYALYIQSETGRLGSCNTRDSINQIGLFSAKPFERFVWHHVVFTFDTREACMYIDGRREGCIQKNFETKYYDADSVILGITYSKKNQRFFNGFIDDVMFYDQVLNEDEIIALYNAPNPNKSSIVIKWCLTGLGFLAIVAAIFLVIKRFITRKLEKEKQQLQISNKLLENELRVNRALMNPHFVFNSLNTLQNFILKNQNEQAYSYLVKFSKLIRKILENSASDGTSLEIEIEILTRYLEIEDLRFEEDIKHTIKIGPNLNPALVTIPLMMLQPFVENAIWHGLLRKKGEKIINISFSLLDDHYLECVIEDNGIGRKRTFTDTPEKKSMAMSFVRNRLNLLNKIHKLNCSLAIEDKPENTGTVVRLILPILNKLINAPASNYN